MGGQVFSVQIQCGRLLKTSRVRRESMRNYYQISRLELLRTNFLFAKVQCRPLLRSFAPFQEKEIPWEAAERSRSPPVLGV